MRLVIHRPDDATRWKLSLENDGTVTHLANFLSLDRARAAQRYMEQISTTITALQTKINVLELAQNQDTQGMGYIPPTPEGGKTQ